MEKRVTSFEVTADFEAIIERARSAGETLVVEHNGEILCRITPEKRPFTGADLARWLETYRSPDPGFANDLQAVIDSQPVEVPRSMWD